MAGGASEQLRVLAANAVDLITEVELTRKLERGTPLRVKLGIDPTASDIHLGFAVVLRKLREFQELGHTAVLILGDFTAQVGDPSGRTATRPSLSRDEIEVHAETYVDQARRILLDEPLEVRRNSEWLSTMGIEDVLRLSARTTVARLLDRDDFATRYREGQPISLMEFLYPLLQGWDSVVVRADVELGGTDQLFNNLVGRTFQEQEGEEGQVVLTLPLLEGLDGVQKMSKSLGNYIAIADPPADQYGKLMSVPDELMPRYFALTTAWPLDQVEAVQRRLRSGELPRVEAKRLLARTVVALYHGDAAAAGAEAEFDRVFRAHETPREVPEHALARSDVPPEGLRLDVLLHRTGLATSNREGRRLISQAGVRRNGVVVEDPEATLGAEQLDGTLLQVGRRRWARIRLV
jgi:tyrosyl-tRNA synthetase